MIDLESDFGKAVKRHLEEEYVIWLTTVDSNGTPQPRPVWFVWEEGTFLIFSVANSHKVRHIAQNPKVALHFNTDNTGDKHVIVFTGEAVVDPDSPPAHEVSAYLEKYESGILGLDMTLEGFSADYSIAIRVKPAEVRGWA
jgi:PPOX class probable F420-dependent enzyme